MSTVLSDYRSTAIPGKFYWGALQAECAICCSLMEWSLIHAWGIRQPEWELLRTQIALESFRE